MGKIRLNPRNIKSVSRINICTATRCEKNIWMQYNFDKGEKFFLLYRTRIVIKIKIMINYRDFPKRLFAKVPQKNDIKKSSFYKNYLTRDFQSRQMPLCVDVSLKFPFSDCKTDGHPCRDIGVTHTNLPTCSLFFRDSWFSPPAWKSYRATNSWGSPSSSWHPISRFSLEVQRIPEPSREWRKPMLARLENSSWEEGTSGRGRCCSRASGNGWYKKIFKISSSHGIIGLTSYTYMVTWES